MCECIVVGGVGVYDGVRIRLLYRRWMNQLSRGAEMQGSPPSYIILYSLHGSCLVVVVVVTRGKWWLVKRYVIAGLPAGLQVWRGKFSRPNL
jgi:hypothetical protein